MPPDALSQWIQVKWRDKYFLRFFLIFVDIYFSAIVLLEIPTEQELLKTVAELQKQKNYQKNPHKEKV